MQLRYVSRSSLAVSLAIVGLGLCPLGCDETDTGSSFSGPDGQAEPPSGVWRYDDGGVSSSTCGDGLDLTRDPDTQFVLANNGDGTFTVDQGQAGEPFDCTIASDNTFGCPSRLFGTEEVSEISATLTWNVSVAGAFSSDTQMSGTQTVDITCAGSGCALAPDFGVNLPCSYTVDFAAEAQ